MERKRSLPVWLLGGRRSCGCSWIKRSLPVWLLLLNSTEGKALTVGQIQLSSFLNQPLRAEVPITPASEEDPEQLRVQIASPEEYARFGLHYAPILERLIAIPLQRPDGHWAIQIVSREPIKTPVLDLLLKIEGPEGRIFRQFTLFLDPPGLAPQPVLAQVAPSAAEPARAEGGAGEGGAVERYRVKAGETLLQIARRFTPPGTTTYQTALALYRHNRHAFLDDNPNLIRAGALLEIPDRQAVQEIPPEEARREFQRSLAAWRERQKTQLAKRETPSTPRPEGYPPPATPRLKLEVPPGEPETASREEAPSSREAGLILALQRRMAALEQQLEQADEELAVAVLETLYRELKPPRAKSSKPVVVAQKEPEEPPQEELFSETAETITTYRPYLLTFSFLLLTFAGFLAFQRARRRREVEEIMTTPQAAVAAMTQEELPAEAQEEAPAEAVSEREVAQSAATTSQEEEAPAEPEIDWLKDFELDEKLALDFDLTGEGEMEVIDPLTEADVYLTYFQYDKAEEIIRKALEEEPNRTDLQFKLLEIYYNKADPTSFEQYAKRFAEQGLARDPAIWARVVEMGRALCPTSDFFKESPQEKPSEPLGADDRGSSPPLEEKPPVEEADTGEPVRFTPPKIEESPEEPPASESGEGTPPPEKPAVETDLEPSLGEPLRFTPPKIEESPEERHAPEEEPLRFPGEEARPSPLEPSLKEDVADGGNGASVGDRESRVRLEVAKTYLQLGRRSEARAILEELYLHGSEAVRSEVRELLESLEEE